MKRFHAWLVLLLATGCLPIQPNISIPNLDAPRSIEAVDTVFLEEMTWMEVRDAMRAGKTTMLVPTGGVEQNGPTWPPASPITSSAARPRPSPASWVMLWWRRSCLSCPRETLIRRQDT
jgi:hypothetical protein